MDRPYTRNRGGPEAEKSWDRQWKLDGMERWHFHIVLGDLPGMLQITLVLLGYALSQYPWTIGVYVCDTYIPDTL